MAKVVFTPNVQRHVDCPEAEAPGRTVREVLDNVFADNPQARGYVLDDQSALRRHMTIFVDGRMIRDRARLADPVHESQHASMCSRPCQEAEDERHSCWFPPAKACSRSRDGARAMGDRRASISSATMSRLTLTDPRDGRSYAALDHGHFGVKLHRSTANGWEEIAAPAYPPKPEGYEENDMWGRPLNWSTARIWALAAGGADEPGVIWCGTLPGGLFRSTDHGAELGDGPRAVGSSQAQAMDGRRRRPAGHPFDLRRSAQFAGACGSRSRPAASGSPRMPARAGRCAARACAPSMLPPEQTHDPIAQDVHCLAQCRGGAGAHVGAAPQRHLRLLRRGPDLHRDHRRRAVDVRLRGRRASARARTPRGSCPRSRTRSASRAKASWWSRARATAARASTS